MANSTHTPLGDRMTEWSFRGRPVVPTTIEGRIALIASLIAWIPFVGWGAILGAPIFLFLAIRRGDRSLLLLAPLLVTLLLVYMLVAEFTVGHD